MPRFAPKGLAGLMDIALHPEFATNGYVYLSYSKPISADDTAVAIARGRWDGRALRDTQDVFVAGAETTGGARMAFGGDGMLYVSAGGGGETHPQDPGQSRRQGAAADAGGPRAGRQSIRRPRRLQARDLHARSSQHARPRRSSHQRARSGKSRWGRTAATR